VYLQRRTKNLKPALRWSGRHYRRGSSSSLGGPRSSKLSSSAPPLLLLFPLLLWLPFNTLQLTRHYHPNTHRIIIIIRCHTHTRIPSTIQPAARWHLLDNDSLQDSHFLGVVCERRPGILELGLEIVLPLMVGLTGQILGLRRSNGRERRRVRQEIRTQRRPYPSNPFEPLEIPATSWPLIYIVDERR